MNPTGATKIASECYQNPLLPLQPRIGDLQASQWPELSVVFLLPSLNEDPFKWNHGVGAQRTLKALQVCFFMFFS